MVWGQYNSKSCESIFWSSEFLYMYVQNAGLCFGHHLDLGNGPEFAFDFLYIPQYPPFMPQNSSSRKFEPAQQEQPKHCFSSCYLQNTISFALDLFFDLGNATAGLIFCKLCTSFTQGKGGLAIQFQATSTETGSYPLKVLQTPDIKQCVHHNTQVTTRERTTADSCSGGKPKLECLSA